LKFRNYVLAALGPEDMAALGPGLEEVALAPSQPIYEPGQPVQDVYFPSSCMISVVTSMSDGRAVETSTIGFESVTGLVPVLSGEPFFNRAFVQVPGSAIRLPAEKLRERAFSSPKLLHLLMRHVEANAAQAQQGVACNALHDASARLARWLLMTQDRVDGPRLPLTQEYLAIMLGIQRTTVTLVAGALKQAGVIDYRRGLITVIDRPGLEKMACECYALLHERARRINGHDHQA
jgi:CRP-like cAMP-binding protein